MTDSYNSPESWSAAKQYAGVFGEIPSTFSSAIRALVGERSKGSEISSYAAALASRLLVGPSMKAPYYFAALTFRAKELQAMPFVGVKNLLSIFPAYDVAVIFGLIYLFRRIKKNGAANEIQWSNIESGIIRDVDLGGAIGEAIPKIGRGAGMLSGAMPWLALGSMLYADKIGVKEYFRRQRSEKSAFDPEWEMQRWGCTTVQVGSLMMQSLGFGVDFASSMSLGLAPGAQIDEIRDPEPYRARVTRTWIDSLAATGAVPDITHSGNYYPLKAALALLLEDTERIRTAGCKLGWLGKTKDDISEAATPQLFESAATNNTKRDGSKNGTEPLTLKDLPPEVLELFSREELEAMSQSELKEILEQAQEARS